jgi:GGDEF domain-containing protein
MLRERAGYLIREWWFRVAATLVAGAAVGVVGAGATQYERSLVWTAVLITSTAIAVAWVLRTTTWARRRHVERDASLQRLRQMGERLAIYDRETGLFAYWYFSLRLNEEIQRSKRYGQEMSVLLLEAESGQWAPEDEAALLQFMTKEFRDCDLAAHIGNLRFIVLLPSTNEERVKIACERLGAAPELARVSVGAASFPVDGEDTESLLSAAGASADVLAEVMEAASDMQSGRQTLGATPQDQARAA